MKKKFGLRVLLLTGNTAFPFYEYKNWTLYIKNYVYTYKYIPIRLCIHINTQAQNNSCSYLVAEHISTSET